MSALFSRKFDKCEYLRNEEILWYDQSRIIGQAKFRKTFEKLTKKIEYQGKKQREATVDHGKQ